MSVSHRVQQLRNLISTENLDGVIISSASNRRFFSGFTGSAGYLFVTLSKSLLLTDFRYVNQAKRQSPEFEIQQLVGKRWVPQYAEECNVDQIGFEDQEMTVSTYNAIQKTICDSQTNRPIVLQRMGQSVDQLRSIKDPGEMELLKRAITITDQAYEEIRPRIKSGMTEKEIAWDLEMVMRNLGAEAMSFDIIVGSGPNAALPHHRADDTIVQDSHPLVIDMGARYEGYCADLTRTLMVGEPDDQFQKIYDIVLRAQTEAKKQAKPGMTGSDLDKIAREIISEAGYGNYFGHSLGHGVGLDVHESPNIGPNSKDILEEGMVFTIEPGIYIPIWGGIRIEDIVVMENGSASVISQASKLGQTI
jgi:Xaa-Pro aminopeptidase